MLKDEHFKQIKEFLQDGNAIKQDLKQAKAANVPNVDLLEERCDNCIKRLHDLKAGYFPGKR